MANVPELDYPIPSTGVHIEGVEREEACGINRVLVAFLAVLIPALLHLHVGKVPDFNLMQLACDYDSLAVSGGVDCMVLV